MRLAGLVEASFSLIPSSSRWSSIPAAAACSRSVASEIRAGSNRSFGPVGPVQAAALRLTKSSMPSPGPAAKNM